MLVGLFLAGLLTVLVASAVPWRELRIAASNAINNNARPVAIPLDETVAPPPTPAPPLRPDLAPVPQAIEPKAVEKAVEPPTPPPSKVIPPKVRAEPSYPVDLDRVLAMMRNRETRQNQPSPSAPPSYEAPVERADPVLGELVKAREMLMAGYPGDARELLIRLQTRMVFRPVTPNTPYRDDVNPIASRVGTAIRAIDQGYPQYAIQTLNLLLTAGLD